jgi:hypothetical protein
MEAIRPANSCLIFAVTLGPAAPGLHLGSTPPPLLKRAEELNRGVSDRGPEVADCKRGDVDGAKEPSSGGAKLTIGTVLTVNNVITSQTSFRERFMVELLVRKKVETDRPFSTPP